MWPAFTFTSDSMYFSAFSATGSFAVTLPVRSIPVSTTPVIPGLFSALQLPLASWVLLRYLIALPTTSSHSFGSGPIFDFASPALLLNVRAPTNVRRAGQIQHRNRMGLSPHQGDNLQGHGPNWTRSKRGAG